MSPTVARVARAPLAGILITLAAMLAMWRDNMNRLPIESVWPTLAAAMVIAACVVLVLRPITGSWVRAGLGSAVAAVYCLYVPTIAGLLPLARWAAVFVHLAVIGLLVFLVRRIPRDEGQGSPIATKVNLVAALLLLITLAPVLIAQIAAEPVRAKASSTLGSLKGQASPDSPDVWHILFDRYAGVDTFRSAYDFDNRPFIAALRERGFTVQDEAFSNYQRTAHSVASTMNGSLLDPMTVTMAQRPDDWVPIYRSMRDSAAIRLFDQMGYRTIFAGSWWEPTRFSRIADESIQIRAMPQLARLAIDTSAIGFWTQGLKIPFIDGRGDQCIRAGEKFRRLRDLARSKDSKYVFAHFLVPHPPFVLNADGSCRSLEQARGAGRRDNYLAQVHFANREALALIDAILNGPRPAVIIIHSDEGPWPAPFVGNEHGLGTDPVPVPWAELTPQQLREKMSILLAVRAPLGKPATMPSSPVQIYPAILRDHFGGRGPLPPSRHYVFESDRALYRFDDITAKLQR